MFSTGSKTTDYLCATENLGLRREPWAVCASIPCLSLRLRWVPQRIWIYLGLRWIISDYGLRTPGKAFPTPSTWLSYRPLQAHSAEPDPPRLTVWLALAEQPVNPTMWDTTVFVHSRESPVTCVRLALALGRTRCHQAQNGVSVS